MLMFATRIPTHFNDGSEIPASLISDIEEATWDRFGGFTFGPPSMGAWKDPETGIVYRETGRDLEVAIDENRIQEAREFVESLSAKLKQESMLFVIKPYRVEFL